MDTEYQMDSLLDFILMALFLLPPAVGDSVMTGIALLSSENNIHYPAVVVAEHSV